MSANVQSEDPPSTLCGLPVALATEGQYRVGQSERSPRCVSCHRHRRHRHSPCRQWLTNPAWLCRSQRTKVLAQTHPHLVTCTRPASHSQRQGACLAARRLYRRKSHCRTTLLDADGSHALGTSMCTGDECLAKNSHHSCKHMNVQAGRPCARPLQFLLNQGRAASQ